jgi:hypothetical protein
MIVTRSKNPDGSVVLKKGTRYHSGDVGWASAPTPEATGSQDERTGKESSRQMKKPMKGVH